MDTVRIVSRRFDGTEGNAWPSVVVVVVLFSVAAFRSLLIDRGRIGYRVGGREFSFSRAKQTTVFVFCVVFTPGRETVDDWRLGKHIIHCLCASRERKKSSEINRDGKTNEERTRSRKKSKERESEWAAGWMKTILFHARCAVEDRKRKNRAGESDFPSLTCHLLASYVLSCHTRVENMPFRYYLFSAICPYK